MARILVTGAGGFTGRYLVPLLAERGNEVHGLVHRRDPAPVSGAHQVHEADLTDRAALQDVVTQVRPEQVVHLAAIAFVAHGDVEELYRTNIIGTRQLLDVLSSIEAPPQSVLIASSANVYGNAREGVLSEDLPPDPANDYGITKLATEQLARLYRDRLPVITARPFNYTGRGQDENFLIPKIVEHVRRGSEVIELGNLDVERDFSDVRTIVDAYARLLGFERAHGETFNICSGKATSLRDIIDLVREISGRDIRVEVNPRFVRADEVRSLSGSPAKIESVIGPLKSIPLSDTLRWMLEA